MLFTKKSENSKNFKISDIRLKKLIFIFWIFRVYPSSEQHVLRSPEWVLTVLISLNMSGTMLNGF